MTSALLSSVGWVYRGLFSSLRQPQQQPGEEEAQAWGPGPQDWGGLPSPAVRPPAGGVEEVYAVGGNAGWRQNAFSPFEPPVACRSRRRRRRSLDSVTAREACGSRHVKCRFTELLRRWSSRSRDGGTPVSAEEEEEGEEERPGASPAASWTSTRMTPATSTPGSRAARGAADGARAECSRSRTLAPHERRQQPVSVEDMRNRVMSAPLSMWELPLIEDVAQSEQLLGSRERAMMGVINNGAEGKVLFAPPETPQGTPPPRAPQAAEACVGRKKLPDVTTASSSPAAAVERKQNTAWEREAHLLALHFCELGSLLQCGSRWGDASLDAAAQKPCGTKWPTEIQPAPNGTEESAIFDDLSRRLLRSTVTGEDRRVRAVYEDVMSTVCAGIIEEEVAHRIQLVEGAALRALDHWAVNLVLAELTAVKQRLDPAQALSTGIRRHIKERKAALLTALEEDAEDKEAFASVLRRSTRGGGQAQETAVSLKSGLALSYQQLATLGPGQWLNDQVINAYLGMIAEERNQAVGGEVVVSLGTHFFARVQQELRGGACAAGSLPALHKDSGILRWLRRRRHILQPGTTRIVLIPVNLSQTHWALAVLNWELHTWYYYDSYIRSTAAMTRGAEVLQQLTHVFLESRRILCEDEVGNASSPADWRLVVARPLRGDESSSEGGFAVAPQQTNLYDCGVFVCHTAWCAAQGVATVFGQKDATAHRRAMLHELLCQKSILQLPLAAFLTP
ncbi:putative SUMO1/Ulp2 [Trypanosoma conorhini]|uniref:Putative SUMO1/Ulp2 n=1 Tax=Trypanosoma conorhini TaxID=83891 RepID=A0A422Q4P8_9TRYP|nr:putative SUMO1/Ulp2 [Trypanosoma conorhini]RNF24923.1 putative SUMO1/Ulp2 [Trypanosoma conorhini]